MTFSSTVLDQSISVFLPLVLKAIRLCVSSEEMSSYTHNLLYIFISNFEDMTNVDVLCVSVEACAGVRRRKRRRRRRRATASAGAADRMSRCVLHSQTQASGKHTTFTHTV